jgi:hypothetical protein
MLRWQRWSAVSGALFAVILFAAILLSGNETDNTQSVAAWFSDSDHQARWVSAFFLGVAASLAFLAFLATLREMLLDAEGGRTGTLSALVSGPGIAFVALLNASLALFAAPALPARDDNFTLDGDTAMMFQNGAWLIFVAAVMVASVFVLATGAQNGCPALLARTRGADRRGPHALRLLLDPGADLPRLDSRCQPLDDGVGLVDGIFTHDGYRAGLNRMLSTSPSSTT